MIFSRLRSCFCALVILVISGCALPIQPRLADTQHYILISIPEQKMLLLENGKEIAKYTISSAKNGVGDLPDSYMTPLGKMEIAEKFGAGLPLGSVLKDRQATGEIVAPDAPGRDPIVSRVLWLRGMEEGNRNAYDRFIYIHGTPQENLLGTPASFGCIRMRSVDVAALYELVGIGAQVWIVQESLENALKTLHE